MTIVLIVVYTLALTFILLYSMAQLSLVIHYVNYHREQKRTQAKPLPVPADKDLPFVTVQLPIFNELYVVERLIDNIAQFDYPRDKLEIFDFVKVFLFDVDGPVAIEKDSGPLRRQLIAHDRQLASSRGVAIKDCCRCSLKVSSTATTSATITC